MKVSLLFLFFPILVFAQTYGPNNPTVGTNVTGVGTLAWSTPGNIVSSNNAYATEATIGTTNYIQGTGFGFALLNTDVVAGIRLDVEKSSASVQDVALLRPWTVGVAPAATPAGINRCAIVIIGLENSTSRDITGVTYGGRPMIQLSDIGLGSPIFFARSEVWYMLESDVALASGTAITYTFAASIPAENFEIVSSAVFSNVDQFIPFNDIETGSTTNGAASYLFPQTINTLVGSMSVAGIFCGAPPSASTAIGNTTAYTINSGFTSVIGYSNSAVGFSTSGGVLGVFQKPSAAIGTEQPTFTFAGSPNRQTAIGFSIRRARQMDQTVRIRKSTGIVGNDLAVANVEWPTTDTYVSYGGASNLWGTSWTFSEINNPGFGAALAAIVQNGTAQVDHMRLSIFTTSILPLELISFTSSRSETSVTCNWITASETNLDYFSVERSTNGFDYSSLGKVTAAGTSQEAVAYAFTDDRPEQGVNYYRLKMVDKDGSFKYSDIISQEFNASEAFNVYPNPASDWATVMAVNGFDEIVITDSQGHIVDRFEGTSLQTAQTLNLYDRADGVYFVCIKKGDSTEVKKLMKTTKTNF